jgi:hypothetical protein
LPTTGCQVGSARGVAGAGSALAAGSRTAGWWVVAGCGALVLLLGAASTGRRAQATAERTRERLGDFSRALT